MIIQRIQRTNTDKVYTVIHNVEGTSITTGQGAVYCHGALGVNSIDGISAVRASTSNDLLDFAGIAAQDIPADGYGRSQIWGWCDSVMMSHRAANTTIGAGLIQETLLIPSATLVGTFTSTAGQDALSVINPGVATRIVRIMDTVVLSLSLHSLGANVWGKAFIRGL